MSKPQDVPAGQQQLQIGIVLSFVTYVIALSTTYGLSRSILHALVDLACSGLFFYGALRFVNRAERFAQAFGALCGAGAILNTAAIPIFLARTPSSAGPPDALSIFAEFLLLVWSLSLFSHVLRHTFEIGKLFSTLIAFAYIIVLISIMDVLLPATNTATPVDPLSMHSPALEWLHLSESDMMSVVRHYKTS